IHVEPRGARKRRDGARLPCEVPQPPLESSFGGSGAAHSRTTGYLLRNVDREVGIAGEQRERRRSSGFGDELSPEIARPDRVRFSHRRGTPVFVAADRERQAEGEDETDDAEECTLQDAERFSQLRLVLTEIAPDPVPESRCAANDREDKKRHLPAGARK